MSVRTRRRRGALVFAVVAGWGVAMLAAVAVLVASGVEDASKWAGVLGSLTALAAFSAPLVERAVARIGRRWVGAATPAEETSVLVGAADGLARAVQVQWRDEARIRRLQDPWPLPVRWAAADADLADHPALVFAEPGTDPRRPGPVGQLREAVDAYAALPHRRMVVIGEPGSGKSVFAMVMVLQLTERRRSGEAVPVIFPMGSWHASSMGLQDWLCKYLTDNYQLGGHAAADARRTARELVDAGLVLPILDGLDEMPESIRPQAIDEINRSLDADQPMILTCRADEYRRAVGSADVLTFGAVVELQPLERETIVRYLTVTTPSGRGRRWLPVFTRLADNPDGPLARVLRSPLMIALTRTAYGDTPRDPTELLDPQFQDATALEDHLLDQLIPASYPERPRPGAGKWSSTDVTPWLTFLARHMTKSGRADLAWWQLESSIPFVVGELVNTALCGVVLGLVFGPIVGVVFTAGVMTFRYVHRDGPKSVEDVLRGRLGPGVRLPLLAVLVGPGGRIPLERRIGVSIGRVSGVVAGAVQILVSLGAGKPLADCVAQGVVAGLAVGLAAGFLTVSLRPTPSEIQFDARRGLGIFVRHLLVSLVTGLGLGVAAGALVNSSFGVVLGVSVWAATGLIDGLNIWLDVSTDVTTALSPRSTCRADRFAAICRASAVGATIGTAVLAAVVLAHGWQGGALATLSYPVVFGVVFAVADRYEGIGASAWGQYLMATIWLSLRGRLPWRLMAFLDDAHEHDVLRRPGAVYQFRHARLQERLTRV